MKLFNVIILEPKLFLIFFFCFCANTFSDAAEWKINGLVLEKGTRRALSDVQVIVREDKALTAISDEKGSFNLTFPRDGQYTLTAATLGSEKPINIVIELKPGIALPNPTFYLPVAPQMDEIVVQGQRSQDRVSKSVISGDELRRMPGSSGDPLAGLQALPGVAATDAGPAVRGSGPADNLYYVDDLPVSKVFHTTGISVFNADLIQDFNLYSAAFAPRYGDATGAIIDVALRDPRNDRLGGKLNINVIGADFLVEGPIAENQSAYFAARRSYIDFLIKQVSQNGVTVQIPNYSDYQGKYILKINDFDRLTFHLQGATDHLKLSVDSNSDIAKQQPVLSGNLSFSDAYAMQAAVWDARIFSDSQNKFALQHKITDATNSIASSGNITIADETNWLHELMHIPLSEGQELTLGSNLRQSRTVVNVDAINPTCTQFNAGCDFSAAPRLQLQETVTTNTSEFSVQDRKRISSKLTLIGGVHNSTEDYLNKTYTEPRLGAEWDWDERTLLTAGWGRHNQIPTYQQIAPIFGNTHLDHLRAEHSVVGISKKLDDDWSWKAEAYYKKLNNLVVGDPQLNYVNGGSGIAYGEELLIKKGGHSDVTGWLSVSLARSKLHNDVTGESFRFEYDQPINATFVSSFKLSNDWTLGTKWTYHSGTPYSPIIGTTQDSTGRYIPIYAAVNSGTLPDYHRLDLRFDRHYIYDKWKLNTYFEINNVYFHKNVIGYSYNANYTVATPVTPLVIPFTFGIQAEF
jgi:hypothetical protein